MILNYGDTFGRTIYTLLDQFTIELICVIYLFIFLNHPILKLKDSKLIETIRYGLWH